MLRRLLFGTHRQFAMFLFILWFLGMITGVGMGYVAGAVQ